MCVCPNGTPNADEECPYFGAVTCASCDSDSDYSLKDSHAFNNEGIWVADSSTKVCRSNSHADVKLADIDETTWTTGSRTATLLINDNGVWGTAGACQEESDAAVILGSQSMLATSACKSMGSSFASLVPSTNLAYGAYPSSIDSVDGSCDGSTASIESCADRLFTSSTNEERKKPTHVIKLSAQVCKKNPEQDDASANAFGWIYQNDDGLMEFSNYRHRWQGLCQPGVCMNRGPMRSNAGGWLSCNGGTCSSEEEYDLSTCCIDIGADVKSAMQVRSD